MQFPSDVSDQDLGQSASEGNSPGTPSHMTYSIHLFRLSRINSEIKYVMHSICRDAPTYAYPPVTNIHEWQGEMIGRLQTWLTDIPQVAGMESIAQICETKYHEMMILLLRPSPGIPEPAEELLSLCFQHAVDLLRGFGELYRHETLLYSRLIVHSIFLGTIIMLHCLCRLPQISSRVQIDDVVADTCISLNVLSSIGEYWTEAKRARDCIQELSNAIIQRLIRNRGLETSASAGKQDTTPTQASGRNTRDENVNEMLEAVDTAYSAVDLAPAVSSLDGCDFSLDATSWLDDSTSGGFMDFAGVPDFDSLMWQVFNNT